MVRLKKVIGFVLAACLLLPNTVVMGNAAGEIGVAARVSSEIVEAGNEVTVTISLEGYDAAAEPIRGIQIDVTGVDESVLSVKNGGYRSLINDASAASNTAVYQTASHRVRLIYAKTSGSLARPYTDVLQVTVLSTRKLKRQGALPCL